MIKAFLGMGLLGSNFVKAMLQKGEAVQIWNRTPSKSSELQGLGASAFIQVPDAVAGADMIHLTLKDDHSVDEVLEAASAGFKQGAVIVDHTTTSKDGAIRRTEMWKEKGILYQHVPVFMGPRNALEGTGIMMVSGDEVLIRRIRPELSKMTGQIIDFGREPGKAAAMKLVGNAFLVCFTAGIRESLSLGKALGVTVPEISGLFDLWNPGQLLQSRLKRMTSGDYRQPSWELNMARKDTGLFLQAAKNKTDLTLIPSIAALMDEWIEKGFGNNDWTVIAKDSF